MELEPAPDFVDTESGLLTKLFFDLNTKNKKETKKILLTHEKNYFEKKIGAAICCKKCF
ncbi:hypothetical protein BpHYR1_028877 [Brachionus plicatilis]|uniref:Uncharacterized protein n=1 Tax=Brachionus plicatilis TaxID=10195 RepID=A0A3M7RGK7_BRAPC|nr:hypothetical protein BpHYR1_028877 [Brachionus plicatilis]